MCEALPRVGTKALNAMCLLMFSNNWRTLRRPPGSLEPWLAWPAWAMGCGIGIWLVWRVASAPKYPGATYGTGLRVAYGLSFGAFVAAATINPGRGIWGAVALASLFVFPLLTLYLHLYRNRIIERVRRGACIACGYDLTGNVSGVCPECGLAGGRGDDGTAAGSNKPSGRVGES